MSARVRIRSAWHHLVLDIPDSTIALLVGLDVVTGNESTIFKEYLKALPEKPINSYSINLSFTSDKKMCLSEHHNHRFKKG